MYAAACPVHNQVRRDDSLMVPRYNVGRPAQCSSRITRLKRKKNLARLTATTARAICRDITAPTRRDGVMKLLSTNDPFSQRRNCGSQCYQHARYQQPSNKLERVDSEVKRESNSLLELRRSK